MKRTLIPLTFAFALFFMLSLIYYLGFVIPSRALPNALRETQVLLSEQQAALLQARIAIIQLAKLNPNSARYIYSKERIYRLIEDSISQGRLLAKEQLPRYPQLRPAEIDELVNKHATLTTQSVEVYGQLETFVLEQRQFDQPVEKIFEFFPRNVLRLENDQNLTVKRIREAIGGLTTISEIYPPASLEIGILKNSLENLAVVVDASPEEYADGLDSFADAYRKLKVSVYSDKMNLLKSDQHISTLSKLTALLEEYDTLLKMIEKLEAEI